ncbi:uncharacterized protein LOC111262836 isoform X1 [Varroa jacobsoni]|uniref:uncharacterized protein LOC111262836 isoform X1 n=1 Tax=Varroa jacobsoni TaxID=62625 RepID=UPI000BF84190|nr:uncharacterized protein LOC111262836 isoform X1 [Varroa jacobsoni]
MARYGHRSGGCCWRLPVLQSLIVYLVILHKQSSRSDGSHGLVSAWPLEEDELTAFSTPRSNSEVASFGLNSLQNSEEHGEDDRYGSHLEDEEPRVTITGVLGGQVGLPCNIQPNSSDDEVSLVLWYKDDSTTPIYSLDSRKTTLRNAHHSPAHWLAGRAYLQAITSGTSSSTHHDVLLLHDSKNGGSSDENVSTTFSRGLRGDASTTSSLVTINNGATVNGMIQGPPSPSVLTLDPLEKEDEALYRCRVDFKRARTRNYEVQLVVIVPPSRITVTDHRGAVLADKQVIGPYNEGEKVVLKCQAHGGNPPPVVTWYRRLPPIGGLGGTASRASQQSRALDVESKASHSSEYPSNLEEFGSKIATSPAYSYRELHGRPGSSSRGAISNTVDLVLPLLSREHLLSSYSCVALNNNISKPLVSSVILDIHFRPQRVWISGGFSTAAVSGSAVLQAGVPATFQCSSSGSRPRAVIQWFKGGERLNATTDSASPSTSLALSLSKSLSRPARGGYTLLRQFRSQRSLKNADRPPGTGPRTAGNGTPSSGNWHTSTVEFVPSPEDDGKTLTCRAHNPAMPSSHYGRTAATSSSSSSFHLGPTGISGETNSDGAANSMASHTASHHPARSSNTPINAIDDGIKLHVQYVPQLTVRLGKKLRHSHIREGSDVFLECDVKANPSIIEMGWRFEGKELTPKSESVRGKKGIIISEHSLVLQNVTRHNRGRYTCTGTNAAGQGESPAFQLRVKYEPRCVPGQRQVYDAAKHEAVRLSCELESDPEEVTFKWKTRNSKSVISSAPSPLFDEDKLFSESSVVGATAGNNQGWDQHGTVHSEGTRSWLTLVPRTEEDYGTVICWGRNSMGVQKEPCVFTLIPAGPPGPVHNCSVAKKSEDSITIQCHEGYDGGAESGQRFYMEVHDSVNQNRVLIANISSMGMDAKPVLTADGLSPSTSYVCTVYAANERGASQPTILIASTIPRPLSLSAKGGSLLHLLDLGRFSPSKNPVTLVIAFIVLTAIIATLVLIALLMRRAARTSCLIKGGRGNNNNNNNKKKCERIEKNDEDESAVPLRDSIKEREQITDLRNLAEDIENDSMCPDIIPETAKLTSSSQTDSSSVAFVESSFIAKRSPTSPTGAVSPMRNVVLPQNNQKSVVGNATGTTTLRSPRSSLADCWPNNKAHHWPVRQGDIGFCNSPKRGSWDLANEQRSRNSLPSSISYQHVATLPRRTTLHYNQNEGPPMAQAVAAGRTHGSTKNVTFDMTPVTHPYAWVDGGCSLILPRGFHKSPRGDSSGSHQMTAIVAKRKDNAGFNAANSTAIGDHFDDPNSGGGLSRSEHASSRIYRSDLHVSRAKLQLLTLAEPQRPALLKPALLQTTASAPTTNNNNNNKSNNAPMPTQALMSTTGVTKSTTRTTVAALPPTSTSLSFARLATSTTLSISSRLQPQKREQSAEVATTILKPDSINGGTVGAVIRAPLANRDEGQL